MYGAALPRCTTKGSGGAPRPAGSADLDGHGLTVKVEDARDPSAPSKWQGLSAMPCELTLPQASELQVRPAAW